MTPAVKEIQHPEYGKCVHIAAGPVAALITIDKGPRILSYSFSGEENILFTENQAKQETGFHAWGGHRITIAPEQEDSFYPVSYTHLDVYKRQNRAWIWDGSFFPHCPGNSWTVWMMPPWINTMSPPKSALRQIPPPRPSKQTAGMIRKKQTGPPERIRRDNA